MNETMIKSLIGGAIIGVICATAGISITHWQFYALLMLNSLVANNYH